MAHRQETSAPPRASKPENRPAHLGTFSSFRHLDYRYLWTGTFFTNTAEWVQQITLGWLVWELSRSALLVGVVGGMRGLPSLVVGPLGGVAADRLDRRKLLMVTQIALAVTAVVFAVLVAMDWVQVWHALLFSFITGCGFALNVPVRQSLVANTVPRSDLGNAIALNSIGSNVTRVIGPAAGGLLIVSVGAAGNFIIQAVLLVGVVVAVFPMRVLYREAVPSKSRSPFHDLRDSLTYMWSDRKLFGMIMMSFVPAFFILPLIQILPAVTDEVLHSNASMYGYLVTAYGVGGVVATIAVASFGPAARSGRMGIASLLIACVSVTVFALSSLAPLSILLMGAVGFFQTSFAVNNNTQIQTLVRDEMRGRVMAFHSFHGSARLLSNFVLGLFAGIFTVSSTVTVTGILGLAVAFVLLFCIRGMRGNLSPQT